MIVNNSLLSPHFIMPKTWLFVPATRIDRIAKAFASGADAVIVDLEDTVAQADKAPARQALQQYYRHYPHNHNHNHNQNHNHNHNAEYQPIWIRINQARSLDFAEDIKLCQNLPNVAGILLAKAELAADISDVHQRTHLPVIALIESAVGLYAIDSMAKASGLLAFSYGFLDLCNDLRVQVGTKAADIIANQIRYQLLVTSKVHQLSAPIDTIYPDFNDTQGLSCRAHLWSQMGMSGMLCIHPKQVATVQYALQPTKAEIEFAIRVVEEYERSGQAVFKIDGNMVDAPVLQRCFSLVGRVFNR